jgi:Autotransporter beta-domain
MRGLIVLMLAVVAAPVHAAAGDPAYRLKTISLSTSAHTDHSPRLDVLDGEEFGSVVPEERTLGVLPSFAATQATGIALDISPFVQRPTQLNIEALAGHRAFDTMRRRRASDGWRMTPSNNELGVGLTGSWGVDMGRDATALPFVSIDYDRIDTARFVNAHSPRPYVVNNADTGLTFTAGMEAAWRFGEGKRFRLGGYGAVVAATGTGGMAPEAASAGARIVQSLTSSDLQPLYGDVGASLSYAAAPRVRISGSVVQTLDRSAGDAMAMRLALRIRY